MRILAALLMLMVASPALADGSFLARLAPNVEAPSVPRPSGPDAVAGVLLQNLAGQAGRITTFGHVFREGDWPQGRELVAEVNGAALPMQVDVKARHLDGSVRHAVLSIETPELSRDTGLALRLAARGESRAIPFDLRTVRERGYNLAVVFDFGGPTVTLDAATLLTQAIGRDPQRWLQGPIQSEIRIERRLTPQLTAIFDIRAGRDGSVRTDISVHNDAMFETANTELPYRYTIQMSGQTLVERQVTHRRHANWREVVWAGAQPSAVHVVYDYPYMIASGAVPAYDPELPLHPAFIAASTNSIIESDVEPFGNALIEKAMPTTGGRGDIGMIPDWTLAWLRTQSVNHRYAMMETAEAAGAVPWHLRDPKTQRAPTLEAYPQYWMDYRANAKNNGHEPIKTKVDGWKLDNAHQPELSFIPYLISGDRYHLDELHAQVAAGLFMYDPRYRGGAEGNLRNDEVRGQAWVNRTHGYAAWITPDAHPEKRYLNDKLAQRLRWYAEAYPRDDKLGGPAKYETAGWIMGANPKGIISNWQQDFFSQSLAQVGRLGFAEAGSVYNFTRRYHLSRFLRADFNSRWSTGYHTIHGNRETRAPFPTWREIARANIADGRFEANPSVQSGDHDKAWNFAAQGRAGYASLVGAFHDPLMSEAYARLVRDTQAMQSGANSFSRYPKWGIVPVFPDGTTLAISNHKTATGRASGTDANELFAGSPERDTLLGEGGNDILAGLDNDDVIAGGTGFNLISGGRGADQIVLEGGTDIVAGGPGADVFYFGRKATGGAAPLGIVDIVDFRPGEDRLALPPAAGDPMALLRGAKKVRQGVMISLGNGASILLRGVRPEQMRREMLAQR